ncbi:O-antigen ligase family protein [Nocardioides hungaricus]
MTAPAPARAPALARPRTAWTVWLPLLAAAVLGLAIGLAPGVSGAALAAGVGLAVLLLRVELAALLVVALAPFEDVVAEVDPRAAKAAAVLLVVAWAIRRCRGRLHHGPRSPVLVPVLAFVVVLLAATAVHNNGTAGQSVVLRYAGFLVVLLVLADVLRGGLAPERLARVYVASCTVAAAFGLVGFALAADRRVGGPIGDPNDFGFFLLAAVPLAVGLRPTARRRWLYDLAVALLIVAILGTLSRGALLGVVAAGAVALVAGMVRLRAVAGIGVLAAAATAAVVVAVPGLVTLSLSQKGYVADQNVDERLGLWQAAAQMTLERPLLGQGPGAFAQEQARYLTAPPMDVTRPLDVAHNTWLEISSELGLLGLAAFAAILVAAYLQARRAHRAGDPLGAGVCAALVGCAVAATFLTEQYYLPLWLLVALAVGVGARVAKARR